MNAERLHALIAKVDEELANTAAFSNLETLSEALGRVVSDSDARSQQQLASALTAFRSGLQKTTIPNWSPAWLELLAEIGAAEMLGERLGQRIDAIITTNAITPAVAATEIVKIEKSLDTLQTTIAKLESGFDNLNIGQEQLDPGECEVGFLIPRRAVQNELGPLASELKELDFILRTISEVATGSVAPVKVRTVSSSDFLVLLAQHSAEAALFATVLERLIAGYKKILEIRKLHGELLLLVGDKPLKEIEKQAETLMLKEITSTADEAIKQYPSKDQGRKNELRNALDTVLRKLADRIDRGFNIEIRIEPLLPADATTGATPADTKIAKQHAERRQIIEKAARQLEFTHRDGSPILNLDKPSKGEPKAPTN